MTVRPFRTLPLFAFHVVIATGAVAAEEVKIPAIADVGVSSSAGETSASLGKTPRFRLKNIQDMALLNFDLRPLRGKRIRSVWLHMRTDPESAQREMARLNIPASYVDPLRHVGVSTVSSPWVEGEQSVSHRPDPVGHGATFAEASFGREPWAWEGSTLADVIFGNGNSVHSHAPLVREDASWWKAPVDVAVIETLLAGGGSGLCVMDETGVGGGLSANTSVFSRESGRWAPYLTVETDGVDTEPPAAPTDLAASPAPEKAGLATGAVRVQLRVPEGARAWRAYADGRPIAPWQLARPGPAGEIQTFYLTDLPPRARFRLEIEAADGAGNVSPRLSAQATASLALASPPELPPTTFRPRKAEPPVREGQLRLWAFPELSKVDPMTGDLMDEPDSATRGQDARATTYRAANTVWDGAAGQVRLAAARGEIVGLQLAIERVGPLLAGVRVQLSPLRSISDTIGAEQFRLWRAWYVKSGLHWHAEIALPLDKPFDVPTADNGVVGQRNQTVWIDVVVPARARPGRYEGTLSVAADGLRAPVDLKVSLEVFNVQIPESLSFWPELNSYQPPGEPGSDYFYEAHRLAHYHRCAINTVPYSQRGSVDRGFAPTLAGEGADVRVADWTAFDRNLGPLLDGSAFAGNPRAGVPIQVMYLPLFENWPLPMARHYAYKGRPGKDTLVLHRLTAPPIEQAFDGDYRTGWIAVARDFVRHFEQKRWDRTLAEFYLNNKWDFGGTSWWLLDEPASRDDFLALRFFGQMWREATREAKTAHFLFRGDISRPQWQGDLLDGLMQIEYVNNAIFQRERTDRVLAERMPAIWAVYGSCNEVGQSNLQTAAWCLRAYAAGADAVLPWSALDNKGESLRQANPNGLIVNGRSLGCGPLASFRVFALRRGAQDVEILKLLADRRGWKREQVELLMTQRLPLSARFRQSFLDEAAAARFADLSARGFLELKEGVLRMLSGP
jgi:hypothetical protein